MERERDDEFRLRAEPKDCEAIAEQTDRRSVW